jgi:hypothetical protein
MEKKTIRVGDVSVLAKSLNEIYNTWNEHLSDDFGVLVCSVGIKAAGFDGPIENFSISPHVILNPVLASTMPPSVKAIVFAAIENIFAELKEQATKDIMNSESLNEAIKEIQEVRKQKEETKDLLMGPGSNKIN